MYANINETVVDKEERKIMHQTLITNRVTANTR